MNFGKGKVRNINKRLVAGALTITFLTAGLTGCSTISIDDIKYTTNESGYVQGIDGTVSYDVLRSCGFYEVENNITKEKHYTILLLYSQFWLINTHYDIFTKQNVTAGDFKYQKIDMVEDYLVRFDMVKEEYTEEELKEVLDKFVEAQEKENTKKLVKGK